MARFSIAYDQNDGRLGDYFKSSKDDIHAAILLNDPNHDIHEIPSESCTQVYIDAYLPTINKHRNLFIAYSHGNDKCLEAGAQQYVLTPANTHQFVNCFFYAMACSTGKILGPALIAKGCVTYIGYKDYSWALRNEYQQTFIDCDNKALRLFIDGATAGEAYVGMKTFMKDRIKQMLKAKRPFDAGYLRHNLAVLVIHGDCDVKFNTF